MLTKKQLDDVCLLGSGASECIYCTHDGNGGHHCVKKTVLKQKIDGRVKKFKTDQAKAGNDPAKANVPLGDNCPGYPFLRHIKQGYDIP